MRFLLAHMEQLGPVADQSLEQLGLLTGGARLSGYLHGCVAARVADGLAEPGEQLAGNTLVADTLFSWLGLATALSCRQPSQDASPRPAFPLLCPALPSCRQAAGAVCEPTCAGPAGLRTAGGAAGIGGARGD